MSLSAGRRDPSSPYVRRPGHLPAGVLVRRAGADGQLRGGPCPPVGRHRYFFTLYALDTMLGDLSTPAKRELERAMQGHILASAELMGTYQRGGKSATSGR